MGNQPRLNTRRSQWEVIDRCLSLLLRLMHGTASGSELREIVADKAEAFGDGELSAGALDKRFEEDRSRLRSFFGCDITYDRSDDSYTLLTVERPLLDLNDDALRGVAFLNSVFRSDSTPMAKEVQALLDQLLIVLPRSRWRDVERERGLLELNLSARDKDIIDPIVWQKVQEAIRQHQQLEFEYTSPAQPEGQPEVLHIVEPRRYLFDAVGGHYYLEACHVETRGPAGRKLWATAILDRFRMGRIGNPRLLPTRFVPDGRRYKTWELVYALTPQVARGGVTKHFENSVEVWRDDGSVEVHVESTNLFFDLRQLLHYGANCRVIGGDEAAQEMRRLIEALHTHYHPT
ncbi:MAG: WYL domain-containing protein [Anaerolineae bacterium]|nr:WYL domain-containing protein [Anaerolineae bacterium]